MEQTPKKKAAKPYPPEFRERAVRVRWNTAMRTRKSRRGVLCKAEHTRYGCLVIEQTTLRQSLGDSPPVTPSARCKRPPHARALP